MPNCPLHPFVGHPVKLRYIYIYTYVFIYVYIYIYICWRNAELFSDRFHGDNVAFPGQLRLMSQIQDPELQDKKPL